MAERPAIAVDLRALVGRPSGIGWFTLALLGELARLGTHRYVGLAHGAPSHAAELAAAGVRLESQRAPLGVLWQQLRLPARLAEGDLALLWSPLLTLPAQLPVPGVVTVHDLTPILLPAAHRLRVRLSVLPFMRRTVATAAAVVADSEATAADLRRLYPAVAGRLHVVYPGVDPAFTPAPADRRAAIRSGLGCPDGYLLYLGTLEPRKNVGILLDAWETLRRGDPETPPLVLAGGYGWKSRALARRIAALAPLGLRDLGYLPRERVVEVVQGSSLFVYPSLYEGFGLPPAEAMACGVPVVAADRTSLPEVVGDAGLLFDPESPAALGAALSRLLAEPALAGELGERGRARAARFRWDGAARRMDDLFAAALA